MNSRQRWIFDQVSLSEASGGEGLPLSLVQEKLGHKRLSSVKKLLGPLVLEGLLAFTDERVRLAKNVSTCPHCGGTGLVG